MAIRIGEYVYSGYLRNKRRNSVCGWVDFGHEQRLHLELTGNLPGDLFGRKIYFTVDEAQPRTENFDQQLKTMESMQAGTIGDVVWHIRKVPTCSMEEFRRRLETGEPLEHCERPVLYLEWFSQNGRVVAEIVDPEISWVQDDDTLVAASLTPQPLPDENEIEAGGPEIIAFTQNEHGFVEQIPLSDREVEASGDDDPCELFSSNLDEELAGSQVGDHDTMISDDMIAPPADGQPRDWADVIPGLDPETKALYEQWDEILHGENHEPVTALFDPPLMLPPADSLTEDTAAGFLKNILARLAEFCIVIDMCEHASVLGTYRWLLQEILPQARFTPASIGSGFVQHYSTCENCPRCEAEFEAEWAERRQLDSDAEGNDEDIPW